MAYPAATPSLLAIAAPVLIVLTAFRALIGAARRPDGKRVRQMGAVAVVLATLVSALALWSEDVVLTLPAGALWRGDLLPFLLGDLAILAMVWTLAALMTIRLARRFGARP